MIGTPEVAHDLLHEYYPDLPGELATDDTNALLGALLLELQVQRVQRGGPTNIAAYLEEQQATDTVGFARDERGEYRSFDLDIETGEWTQIESDDLGFVAREIDLRNTEVPVDVAFQSPGSDRAHIRYTPAEMPVAGIPVTTASVWVRVAESASSSEGTITVDCWSRGR
jgi:hypothetical protein